MTYRNGACIDCGTTPCECEHLKVVEDVREKVRQSEAADNVLFRKYGFPTHQVPSTWRKKAIPSDDERAKLSKALVDSIKEE